MSTEDVKTFKNRIKKVDGPREHKVKNSLGIRNAFLYLQSHKWLNIGQALPERTFQQLIREINNLLALEVMEGRSIIFPEKMGSLDVVKRDRFVDVVDGKIITNYMVDWDKTLELWSGDEEAYQNRTLVRDVESKERVKIHYNRRSADYNNKSYFIFKPNRSLYRILRQNINKGRVLDMYAYGKTIH